jgi:hypothetical protein
MRRLRQEPNRAYASRLFYQCDVLSCVGRYVPFRKAKVNQMNRGGSLSLTDQDVFRFHVPVNVVLIVKVLQAVQNGKTDQKHSLESECLVTVVE